MPGFIPIIVIWSLASIGLFVAPSLICTSIFSGILEKLAWGVYVKVLAVPGVPKLTSFLKNS